MAGNSRKDLPGAQILASCDSSGVTIIHEETPLSLEENGTVEISYINISEDVMVSELELFNATDQIEDDCSRQSSEIYDDEVEDLEGDADEEHKAITNDYLSGKISFKDFITRVETSDDVDSSEEILSDEDEDEPWDLKDDPDFVPPSAKAATSKRSSKTKSLSAVKVPASSQESDKTKSSLQSSTTAKKPKQIRTMKKLPANLLG